MTRKLFVVAMVCFLLTGCATPPNKITATYVSPMEYVALSDEEVIAELNRVSRKLREVSGVQQAEADKDGVALGVGLVLFWPALLFMIGPDEESEIASLKGQYEALEATAIKRSLGIAEELKKAREERQRLEAEEEQKKQQRRERRRRGPNDRRRSTQSSENFARNMVVVHSCPHVI